MKTLLEAGVHFGHQTRRWNPKMSPFIFGKRNGIYIIDLQKTLDLFKIAAKYVRDISSEGWKILFVGTKRQAADIIEEEAKRCGMYYVNNRWLGGLLTNFNVIKKSIERLREIEKIFEDEETLKHYTKKERIKLQREKQKLEKNLKGIKDMDELPDALFVVDPEKEANAVKEARKLGIPVIAVVDTNCDPDMVDVIIPGNDDAIRAIKLFVSAIADAVLEGQALAETKAQDTEEEGEEIKVKQEEEKEEENPKEEEEEEEEKEKEEDFS
ncbi:MAG: 30S ribosomal protein S2 [Thermoanaerobaculia bacterium]